eukprot:scaffold3034_cov173-Amphora_coffeaeformis.AAC.19
MKGKILCLSCDVNQGKWNPFDGSLAVCYDNTPPIVARDGRGWSFVHSQREVASRKKGERRIPITTIP